MFLTYRDNGDVTQLVNARTKEKPLYDFTAPDNIRHTVWRIPGGAEWVKAFSAVPATYIADGHHRAASAARSAGREVHWLPPYRAEHRLLLSDLVGVPADEVSARASTELAEAGGDTYTARVHAGIASIKGIYDGEVQLTDQDPPNSYTLRATGSGGPRPLHTTPVVTLVEDGEPTRAGVTKPGTPRSVPP